MNNCDNPKGKQSSSSDFQELQQTVAFIKTSTEVTASTSVSESNPTVAAAAAAAYDSNVRSLSSPSLQPKSKLSDDDNESNDIKYNVTNAIDMKEEPVSKELTESTVQTAKTAISYAAITAMDTASATAIISAQKQQIQEPTEAINSTDNYCDKNLTNICDKNDSKPHKTTTQAATKTTESEPIIVVVSKDPICEKPILDEEPKLNVDKASVAMEESGISTPSPILAAIGKQNSILLAQKKIDNNQQQKQQQQQQQQQEHQHLPPLNNKKSNNKSYALTTTASAPVLMQRATESSSSSSSSSSNLKLSGSGSMLTTPTLGLNSGPPLITRRVSFPKSDEALVTGYLEPANPWEHVCMVQSISEIAELYAQSCNKHKTTPIPSVLDHLKHIELDKSMRQPILLLKNTKLEPADCEALEEIFKRVQYKSIDVSSCELNETAASALFDMFEYYEVTNELDISSNAEGMTSRGWTSCIYMVSHSRALQVLNAQGNPLSKNCADNLGSALNSSNLHTIKLEHCGLRGNPLDSLCTKLRNNQILKELWLAYNDLTCTDADKIAQLLRTNHYLQLIDISNNNIKDDGLMKIVKALIEQSTELERQRIAAAALAYAIAEAENKKRMLANSSSSSSSNNNSSSSSKSSTNTNNTNSANGTNGTDDEMTSGDSDASPAEEEDDDEDEDEDDDDDEADDADVDTDANDAEDDDGTTTEDDAGGGSRPVEDDDDDEDTVKTSTIKTTPPINGQSKLDKLLSMNNSDSSEEAPTDTVAASDISVSDDIFDSTSSVVPIVSSTPIVKAALDQQPATNNNNNNTAAATASFEENVELIDDTVLAKPAVTPSKALDVNKNSTKLDDFDDTHSTDSAFESSSDGDISRHLPDEFVDRFDGKDEVETAVIATEALTTPTPTPTSTPPPPTLVIPPIEMQPPPITTITTTTATTTTTTTTTPQPIEVVQPQRGQLATSASPNTSYDSSIGEISLALKNAALTGTSPSPASSGGGGGGGMRRTESTCTINQSTRIRSHSTDSLSSDNSLDGSISDTASGNGNFSTRINEKLTKNDTLTRQKQFDVPLVDSTKTPHGLKALTLWNNNLTKESGPLISDLLATTVSLELLNVGKNILSNDFVASIRDSLSQNTTLTTLGLQSAHLSCAGIRTLSSILQFGGNSTLTRIDIRDNKIEVESLNMLAEALKSNTTVTQIDIDDEPKRLSVGSDAQLDYARVLENVRSLCSRNENQPPPSAASASNDKMAAAGLAGKRRGGYYLGSRKISLTCHSAPPRAAIVDQSSSSSTTASATASSSTSSSAATTSNGSKLEVKKKTGVRLRSPIPSPPTISPSSSPVPSPSKSRFQVFRVSEVSPLTSPMTPSPSPSPTPPSPPTPLTSSAATSSSSSSSSAAAAATAAGVLINSKDSTTTIKRLSTSPRSRFHVMKIYEDLGVPIAHRTLPPITPSPSPPTAPSIKIPQSPLISPNSTILSSSTSVKTITIKSETTKSVPLSNKFAEQTIITTPATPPIQEEAANELLFENDSPFNKAITTITPPVTPPSVKTLPSTPPTTIIPSSTNILPIATMSPSTTSQLTSTAEETSPSQSQVLAPQTAITPPSATTTPATTNNLVTNTKPNLKSLDVDVDVNESTNTVFNIKPKDLVDGGPTCPNPVQCPTATATATSTSTLVQIPFIDEKETTKSSPPIAIEPVLEDDQRTLTNSPLVDIDTLAVTCTNAQLKATNDPQTKEELNVSQDLPIEQATIVATAASPAPGRTRKNSWIPNSTYPATVDRLLSMFQNPAHLFHRSSSPDTTSTSISTSTSMPPSQSHDERITQLTSASGSTSASSDEDLQQSLVPIRRRTPPQSVNQFPWCKLGTEMCKPVTSVMQTAAAVSSNYVACGPPTTAVVASVESPRSFFDAASKQLRDFSKQVFRQNIAFGNEAATNINLQEQQQLLLQQQQQQHDCDIIPSDMKLEIKENISPEHTINEEQLQTLQKIGGSPGSSSTSSSSGTETTEGASIPSSSSSPSSLLSVPLLGFTPVPINLTTTAEEEDATSISLPTTTFSTPQPQPQHAPPNEEQYCNS